MYKFIIIKKNFLIMTLVILFIMTIGIYFNTYSKNTVAISDFILASDTSENNYDLNGDGIADKLSIVSNNSAYSIRIKTDNESYILKSNTFDYILFDVSPTTKLDINFVDLNRNKIPEIIIRGEKNKFPITYIFSWNGAQFEEVLFTQKNILGIINYNNSQTPQVLHTSSSKGDEDTEGFVFKNNSIKNITFSKPKIPSLEAIQKLIDLIQLEYEITDAPGIFTSSISSDELGLLWNLDKEQFHYTFQNGYFFDTAWDDSGKTKSVHWCLSFKRTNILNSNENEKEITIYVNTILDELNEFKIDSIKKS